MDLDGTTVRSEHFWIWIIEKTIAGLLGDPHFKLEAADEPYVSGHSVSEHLQYGIRKYCPDKSVEAAREWYFKHTNHEMNEILEGRGKKGAFTPSPGIKEFLLELKAMGLKIALVTSGLYEKAWPEMRKRSKGCWLVCSRKPAAVGPCIRAGPSSTRDPAKSQPLRVRACSVVAVVLRG